MSQRSMSESRVLLLTDVVDSTRLSASLGDSAMAGVWSHHDTLARRLLREWHGLEIDKSDGLFLLFTAATDAVGFATAYHAALSAEGSPLKVRVGIHLGMVSLRPNNAADVALGAKPLEVDGLAKPIAARVMSVARGGQTLMTRDVRRTISAGTAHAIRSHGHWRLAGIDEALELFEVGLLDALLEPPVDAAKAYRVVLQREVWIPARDIRHTLPAERNAFVGRTEPLQRLASFLEQGARMVCVLGMGGAGKTRLAVRFAWTWLGEYPGGVWLCDLSQARSADGIFFAVAQGLDIPLGATDPGAQLAHAIAGRGKCLLILDNFEQVVVHAESTVGRWLDQAPEAVFVVTSREVLGIAGVTTLLLAPMPHAEASALFLRRAEAVLASFHPDERDVAAIEKLVDLLEGLPLAIELAAARMGILSPLGMLARIGERFKLLASRDGRSGRQSTLRTAFDWSWDLLPETDKAALAQMSVFVGGFTLQAAEAVLDLPAAGSADLWTLDVVQSLVDKSFVRRLSAERFDLLESVREYAGERLRSRSSHAGSGPVALLQTEIRHGAYFSETRSALGDKDALHDLDNRVAACRRAVARGDAPIAVATCRGAWETLRLIGPFRVGTALIAAVQAMAGLSPAEAETLCFLEGLSRLLCGETGEARRALTSAFESARRGGNRKQEGNALASLAELSMNEGHMEAAKGQYEAALQIARELQDRSLECSVLNGLGTYYEHLGEFNEARLRFEDALATARTLGDRSWEGGAMGNLGLMLANLGDNEAALPLYAAAVEIARSLGDRQWEGNVLCNLGLLQHAQGNFEEARTHLQASLTLAKDLGHSRLESVVLCNLGLVYEALQDRSRARQAYEAALAIARDRNDRRSEGQFLGYLGLLHAREGRALEARSCLHTGKAALMEVSDRVSLAILLCALARAEEIAGHGDAGQASFVEACSIATRFDIGNKSELAVALAETREQLAPATSATA